MYDTVCEPRRRGGLGHGAWDRSRAKKGKVSFAANLDGPVSPTPNVIFAPSYLRLPRVSDTEPWLFRGVLGVHLPPIASLLGEQTTGTRDNVPKTPSSPLIVSSASEPRRCSTTSDHGAVLGPAGCLVAWVKPWDAPVAPSRACSSLLGCKVMILEATVYAIKSKVDAGCWMPQAKGAAAMLLVRAALRSSHFGTSDERLDARGRAQVVVSVDENGPRDASRGRPRSMVRRAKRDGAVG